MCDTRWNTKTMWKGYKVLSGGSFEPNDPSRYGVVTSVSDIGYCGSDKIGRLYAADHAGLVEEE